MHLNASILGKHAVDTLQARIKTPILTIGSDRFTRGDLAGVACFNFLAAARLSALLSDLRVKDTKDLFMRIKPSALTVPGLGVISLATVGATFEQKIGKTLTDWVEYHQPEHSTVVTFDSMKRHSLDSKAERTAKKFEKTRRQSRTARAGKIRTERFLKRHTAQAASA